MITALLASLATWLAVRPGATRAESGGARVGPAGPLARRGGSEGTSFVEDPFRRSALCVVAGAAAGWVLAGALGSVAGLVGGGVASWWIGRLESPRATRDRMRIRSDLPLVADLLAGCIDAGLTPEQGLDLVSRAVGGPLGEILLAVQVRISLGADPGAEWALVAEHAELSGLGRTLQRTLESGAPAAPALARFAVDRRRELRTESQVRARRVGVLAAAPLGLCFLPAFVLVGVVPTIAGLFAELVGG